MALDYTGIGLGIELDNGAVILDVTGAPGGAGNGDEVGVASLALSDNGSVYRKHTAGAGAANWEVIGSTNDISWREPVLVKDDTAYANLAAAEAAVNTGTVDGETVAADDRILFTNITGSNKNVFIVTGTPGSGATLTEDSNAATINDVVRVDAGTSAEQVFYYDGANWVSPDAAILAELVNIRNFIGKPASGPTSPDYTSEQVVTDGQSLVAAISSLDEQASVPSSATGVTGGTATTLEQLLTADFLTAEWTVHIREDSTGDTERYIVRGFHNGDGTAAATDVKNDRSRQRSGNVNGASVTVVLTGAGATQTMDLVVNANNNYSVHAIRTNAIRA